ncbi:MULTISPECIES: DUF4136 domain-containing protein [Shewanella]|uniref:DUF4136 domain-containing protein n=1 Tax=Shewanella polaris TaxID=2588449 RepID=A0A4Y5YGX8_9GAMM|nr:DUF4136 domain-containing protein [Shewanella polaris]QDE31779.1 DUF4136 domain-containing protein [Shewanella polaris]
MLRNLSKIIFFLSIVLLTACTTNTVSTTPNNRITIVASGDLSTLSKTYAWHETMFVVHTANKMDEDVLRKQLISSVNKLMANKGYQLVSINDSPQMIVGFGMALESEMSDTEILAKVGLVPGLYTQDVNGNYEKGSVLIAFFNPRVNLPFWRVLAQGFTEPDRILEEREARFDALITMMLNDIPQA